MPRYLVETSRSGHALGDLLGLTSARFPELALEHRYALDGEAGRDAWVCRAASELHVERWATAAGLALNAIHRIDGDDVLVAAARSTR